MKMLKTLLALCVATTAMVCRAEDYPAKAITMVVPSAPAGSTDIVARIVADQLRSALGQTVIVDNRSGASGNIGTEAVARAAPDGYTLLMQYSGYHVGNPSLFPQIRWNPIRDFAPIALVMRAPHVIAVNAALPIKSVPELVAYANKGGKGIFYASSGNGSIQHIAGELLSRQLKVLMTHVPYKGAGPAINDLISGQVDMFITTPPSVMGHISSGRVKALAYTGTKRLAALPNVPTSAEAGLPGYEIESWFAVFAPAKTPPAVVSRLTQAIKKIVESDDFKKKMEEQGAVAAYMDPPALVELVRKDLGTWSQVIKDANIKAD